MTRPAAHLAVAVLSLVAGAALAQTAAPPAKPGATAPSKKTPAPPAHAAAPAETRVRGVLNFAAVPGSTSYSDLRTPIAYAETAQIRTSYDASTGLGLDVALQASLYHGLGLLVGYTYTTRDATGTVDVTRPHPLYLNRPRTATAELSGNTYKEGALDIDAAYARAAGHLDWALFGGVTLFKVQADLLDVPTFNEVYPYDQLTILSTPTSKVQENATGWNVGGRLDYRFGRSKRFGAGIQLRYSNASVELAATQVATPAKVDAGGLSVGAGLRVYF